MTKSAISFGSQTFDPVNGMLRDNGMDVRLGQRAAALLQALIAADNQPVTKSTLLEAAWPGAVVEEGNLTVQIAALRKALGTRPDGQNWIVTVPRLGYRLFRGEAGEVASDLQTVPVLAVLPFANLGGDPEQDYFADGVVEDITTALSRFKSFAVIARNSSFFYKGRAVDVRQVASELGVRYVLEGSIRRASDQLRISTQLVDCDSGRQIWAEQYDGTVDEVFAFQDKITESVAMLVEPLIQQAEIERSRRERPGSIAAYDLYLRAVASPASETANTEAYELLSDTIRLEPMNAVFLAQAARTLSIRSVLGWPPITPDDRETCAALITRALQHAAGDAIVLAQCGEALMHFLKDYDWAMSVLDAAVDANPNCYWVVVNAGLVNLHCGSVADSLDYFHRAIRLSPHDTYAFVPLTGIAHCHMVLGEFVEALNWATRSLTLRPNFVCTHWMLIAANAQLGRMDEARKYLAAFRKLVPGVTIASIWAGQPQKDPSRCAAILDGLRLAGLPE